MKKIKVIQIVEDMKMGGLERILTYIVEKLDKSRFSVEVWCIVNGGEFADELRKKGYPVRILGLKGYYNPLNILTLARLLKKERVQILHSHAYFANTMGRLAAILAGVPVKIAHIHGSHWTTQERSLRNYLIDKALSYFTDRIIACSHRSRTFQIQKEKIKPKKLITIHNAVNIDMYSSGKVGKKNLKELKIKQGSFVIGCVGRLIKIKGYNILLEAVAQLFKSVEDLKLIIVGYGAEEENLRKKTISLGLDDVVVFTGSRDDVPEILALFNIFVQPTLIREGLPLTIIEAMAAQLPVVATDVGGIKEAVIHNQTGLIIHPGDASTLAGAIEKLYQDKRLREQMGKAGYKLCVEQFSSDKMVREIELLYLDELGKSGRIE